MVNLSAWSSHHIMQAVERYSSPDGKLTITEVYRAYELFGRWHLTSGQALPGSRWFRSEDALYEFIEADIRFRQTYDVPDHSETVYGLPNGDDVRIREQDYNEKGS